MTRQTGRGHAISGVFIFALLGFFAILSTMLVLFGVHAYQNTLNRTENHNAQRVLQSYIRNAVRAADEEDAVHVVELDGITALTITENEDGDAYIKYIYLYDGLLRELYIEDGDEFEPDNGEEIAEASAFSAERMGQLLSIRVSDPEGVEYDVSIALYAGA